MGQKLVAERFAFERGGVDRTGAYPKVCGVLLCGSTSANRRRYGPKAFADAAAKYDGRPVFLDHRFERGQPATERQYRDQIGWVENVRLNDRGYPVGDVAVKPKHPEAEAFLWDAEHRPTAIGMSHVAVLKYRQMPNGWEEVDAVSSVVSVDVVTTPATTKGLYTESRKGNAVPFTLKQLAEWVTRHPKSSTRQITAIKRVAEMHDLGGMDVGAEPAADMEPADGVKDAFISAAHHLIQKAFDGEMDSKELAKKLRKLLDTHGDVNGAGDSGGGDDTDTDDSDPTETDAEESVKRKKVDPFALIAECEKVGYRPSAVELKFLAWMGETDRAAWLTEQRAKATTESVKSVGRNPGATTAGKQPAQQQKKTAESRLIPAWDAE